LPDEVVWRSAHDMTIIILLVKKNGQPSPAFTGGLPVNL
jgi:hypothetical protein